LTFACELCGAPVEVPVRRNHRYCASCKEARVRGKKNEWQLRKAELRASARRELDWADEQVAQILGVRPDMSGRCRGCGAGLPPKKRAQGRAREWCSEACRVRVVQRGIGVSSYTGALLADPCVYCGEQAAELDHIVAAGTGGDNDWSNIAPVCRRCNSQKKAMGVLRFMLARPLFVQAESIKAELAGLRAA
jgi:5-methylcytosine-specific restriction endonuclease McrA